MGLVRDVSNAQAETGFIPRSKKHSLIRGVFGLPVKVVESTGIDAGLIPGWWQLMSKVYQVVFARIFCTFSFLNAA